MIQIHKQGILLEKTSNDFENLAVLNPGVIREENTVHLFYRAVNLDNESSIGYCRLEGPDTVVFRNPEPLLVPEYVYEAQGMEDPRIIKIDSVYYLTYTAYDGTNALGALATSTDLQHFEKQGIIVPQLTYFAFEQLTKDSAFVSDRYWSHFNANPFFKEINRNNLLWDKNVFFFPRRIHGKLCFLHRIKPDIQLVYFNELSELTPDFWNGYISQLDHFTVLKPKFGHEHSYLGGGAPPIETAFGWLLIYHGVQYTPGGNVYAVCAALLDINDPLIELARLPYPLFEPEYVWERKGEVNNVCFPCGTALFGDMLFIYYGAADEQIAFASVNISDLLEELKSFQTDAETPFNRNPQKTNHF